MFSFGFYNSINKDRRYDAVQVSQIFDGVISDGVYPTYGARFHTDKYAPRVVRIDSGRAWFNHTWNLNDGPIYMEALASDANANRYDAVVIEVNSNPEVRRNEIKWVKGPSISGGVPEFPVMTHTEYINQYPLVYVYRPAGTNDIPDDGGIINNAGNPSCPWAMIYKSMVEKDPGEEGGGPSELEKYIVYNNDTLDFKASTLMQNGKPLIFNDDKGKIEKRVLYSGGRNTFPSYVTIFTLTDNPKNYDIIAVDFNFNDTPTLFDTSIIFDPNNGTSRVRIDRNVVWLDNVNRPAYDFKLGTINIELKFEGTSAELQSVMESQIQYAPAISTLRDVDVGQYAKTPILIGWHKYIANTSGGAYSEQKALNGITTPNIVGYKIKK